MNHAAPLIALCSALFAAVLTGFTSPSGPGRTDSQCLEPDPPVYYSIDLVTTRRVPGTRMADGRADVLFAPSPFGVAVSGDGSYAYDLQVRVRRLAPAADGVYAVWVTTPDLRDVRRLGDLGADGRIDGRVEWNKFLVVISLEPEGSEDAPRWTGPIVLRGLSRSGLMHTMAGHGPFQAEPCATYGYR